MRRTPARRHPGRWFLASLLAFAAGVLYFVLPADALPPLLPGSGAGSQHLIADSMVALFFSLVFLITGMAVTAAADADRRAAADRAPGSIRRIPADPDR